MSSSDSGPHELLSRRRPPLQRKIGRRRKPRARRRQFRDRMSAPAVVPRQPCSRGMIGRTARRVARCPIGTDCTRIGAGRATGRALSCRRPPHDRASRLVIEGRRPDRVAPPLPTAVRQDRDSSVDRHPLESCGLQVMSARDRAFRRRPAARVPIRSRSARQMLTRYPHAGRCAGQLAARSSFDVTGLASGRCAESIDCYAAFLLAPAPIRGSAVCAVVVLSYHLFSLRGLSSIEGRLPGMLRIENLHATVDGKAILKGISLAAEAGRDPRDHGAERLGQVDARLRARRAARL